jgi:hypothetical protein
MKFFCLTRVAGGVPDIGQLGTDYTGHVQVDSVGSWGAYLISGSGAQLTAINALPQVIGICQVTENGVRWGELDSVVSTTVMNKLNAWKTANRPTWPAVTAGMTYRTIINFLFNKFNVKFNLNAIDISE